MIRLNSMQKGFATIFIIGLVIAALAVIVGGSVVAKNTILKPKAQPVKQTPPPTLDNNDLVPVKIHILNAETEVKCKPIGIKDLTDADSKYTQAEAIQDKCIQDLANFNSPEASKAASQSEDCKSKSDQSTKSCNDQIDKNSITLDQFSSCIKQVTADYKVCLQDTNYSQDSTNQARKDYVEQCNQDLEEATKNVQDLIKLYCVDTLQ